MNVAPDAGQFHYDLMAAALRHIEARRDQQPSLEQVAAAIRRIDRDAHRMPFPIRNDP